MSRPTHLTLETDIFQIQGSSALDYGFESDTVAEPSRRHLSVVPPLPESVVQLAHETDFEDEAQARFTRWRGALALATTTEIQEVDIAKPKTNLLEQLREARKGNVEAAQSVRLNVAKATREGYFKENHITEPVEMERGPEGQLIQFGQSLESVHGNAILMRPKRHATLKSITEAEALNGQRIQLAAEQGELKDNYYAVASIVPNGVPEAELDHRGDGYFLEDLTFVWQVTTELPSGKVSTESGFMAGVESDGKDTFDERIEARFDIKALQMVYKLLGFDPPETAAEFIENGMFFPKSKLRNGLLDLMLLTQLAADEVQGREVERKIEDFIELREESRRNEASVKAIEDKVFTDLVNATYLETPMQPVALMWKLVKDHGVKNAMINKAINPIVFGRPAAASIVHGRESLRQGNFQAAQSYSKQAEKDAVISGCGGGGGGGGSWLREQMNKLRNALNERMSQEELAKKYGEDVNGVPLAFYCEDCGYLNVRNDPKRRKRDGTYRLKKHCGGCQKDVSCGDPDAV